MYHRRFLLTQISTNLAVRTLLCESVPLLLNASGASLRDLNVALYVAINVALGCCLAKY